jgi:ABC-type proline/glycine betaine transport system substrate-binding protein
MSIEPLLPEDLTIAPDDPHHALEGFDPTWPYRSVSLLDPRLYFVRLFHTQHHDDAETNALELGRKIAEGGYKGLVMDYRRATLNHDGHGFGKVADAFAANFPKSLLIAYICDEDTWPYARLMTAMLKAYDLKTTVKRDFDSARTAIVGQLKAA